MRPLLALLMIMPCASWFQMSLPTDAVFHGAVIKVCLSGGVPISDSFPPNSVTQVVGYDFAVVNTAPVSTDNRCRTIQVRPAVFDGLLFKIQVQAPDGTVWAHTYFFRVYKFPLRPMYGITAVVSSDKWNMNFSVNNWWIKPYPVPIISAIDILRFTAYSSTGVNLGTYDVSIASYENAGQIPTLVPKFNSYLNFQNAQRFTLSYLQVGLSTWTHTSNGFLRTPGTDSWAIINSADTTI